MKNASYCLEYSLIKKGILKMLFKNNTVQILIQREYFKQLTVTKNNATQIPNTGKTFPKQFCVYITGPD